MESFTIHGLSKVFVGKLWERVFWGFILIGVLGFLSFKVHGFYSEYKKNEFRTEIRMVDAVERTWPEIKVCSESVEQWMIAPQQLDFCYKNQSFDSWHGAIHCVKQMNYISMRARLGSIPYTIDNIKPTSCVDLNVSQGIKEPSNDEFQFYLEISGLSNRAHEHAKSYNLKVFEIFVEGDPVPKTANFGDFTIFVNQVSFINRLSHPFKSNCTHGGNDLNVFSPPYTRQKCRDTILFYSMLAHCADVPNHWQKFVKPHHLKTWNYKKLNWSYENAIKCIYDEISIYHDLMQTPLNISECPQPCREIITEAIVEVNAPPIKGYTGAFVKMRIPSMRITEVHEIATYTSDNFFAEVGSWLGLLVGMSFLSLVEIATFTYTVIKEKCS